MTKFLTFLAMLATAIGCHAQLRISQYPNTNALASNQLFIVTSGNTNQNISFGQLKFLMGTNGYGNFVTNINNYSFTTNLYAISSIFMTNITTNLYVTQVENVNNSYVTNLYVIDTVRGKASLMITNVSSIAYVTNLYATNLYVSYAYTTNIYGGDTYTTNLWVTNLYDQRAYITTNLNQYSYVTNLYGGDTYTTNLWVTNLYDQRAYITTNFNDYSFITNLFVYNTNIANTTITTNLYVTQTNINNTTITTNLYVSQTNINNTSIITNLYVSNVYVTNIFANTNTSDDIHVNGTAYINNGIYTNAVYTYAASASNAPAPNEFPSAQWVRSLFTGGKLLYNVTNAHPVNTTYYQAADSTNATAQVRLYTNFAAGTYLGTGIMSTQRFTTVYSPMTVNAYMSLTGTGSPATTVHPEFYYTYDGTNLLGDFECGGQALISGQTNLKTFVISFPTITATNTNGFYVVRRIKVDSQSGASTVVGIHGSGSTPSTIAFQNPPVTDISLGARGALAMIVTNCPAITNATYDTNSRTFTVSGPSVIFATNRTITIATNSTSSTIDFLSDRDWYDVPTLMVTNLVLSPTNLMAGREIWVYFTAANGNYDVTITNTAATDIRWNLNSATNGTTSFTVTNGARAELSIVCRTNNVLHAVYGQYR